MTNQFRFQITLDGSPTMETLRPSGEAEKMHHSKGAYSETKHVYGTAMEKALGLIGETQRLSAFSLGLGLGYVEIMVFAVALSKGHKVSNLDSFESEPELIQEFTNWLLSSSSDSKELLFEDETFKPLAENSERDFRASYNWILNRTAEDFGLSAEVLKSEIKGAYQNGSFKCHRAFSGQELSQLKNSYHLIFYDAFSEKVDASLWEVELLEGLIKKTASAKCVFTTYASKGRVKRLLAENKFILSGLPGFGGKRECTIAIRT